MCLWLHTHTCMRGPVEARRLHLIPRDRNWYCNSPTVSAVNPTWILWRAASVLNRGIISPSPKSYACSKTEKKKTSYIFKTHLIPKLSHNTLHCASHLCISSVLITLPCYILHAYWLHVKEKTLVKTVTWFFSLVYWSDISNDPNLHVYHAPHGKKIENEANPGVLCLWP